MIKYSLGCYNNHDFEGWFSSSEEFDRLAGDGLVDCPVCGSTDIEKQLMAPAVKSPKRSKSPSVGAPEASMAGQEAVSLAAVPALPELPREMREEIVNQMRQLKQHVVRNAENVGERFVDEARSMHYGEKERRGIYGTANPSDAAELMEEGVEIMPLPILPEDMN